MSDALTSRQAKAIDRSSPAHYRARAGTKLRDAELKLGETTKTITISAASFAPSAGWTHASDNGQPVASAAASDQIKAIYADIVALAGAAGRSFKVNGFTLYYYVDNGSPDDVVGYLIHSVYPETGGDDMDGVPLQPTTVDDDHDTAEKRSADGNHAMTVSYDDLDYVTAGEGYSLGVVVTGESAGEALVVLLGASISIDIVP